MPLLFIAIRFNSFAESRHSLPLPCLAILFRSFTECCPAFAESRYSLPLQVKTEPVRSLLCLCYSTQCNSIAKLINTAPLLSVAKLSQRIHSVASPCLCQTTLHHSNQYPASPSQIKPVDTTPLRFKSVHNRAFATLSRAFHIHCVHRSTKLSMPLLRLPPLCPRSASLNCAIAQRYCAVAVQRRVKLSRCI